MIVAACTVRGLSIFENVYPAGLRQPVHTHNRASLSVILAGRYRERVGRQARTGEPSTLVMHPAQESHAVEYHEEVRILSVQVDGARLARIREHSTAFESAATYRSARVARLGRLLHREFRRREPAWPVAIEGLVLELIVTASRDDLRASPGKPPAWLALVEEALRSHFATPMALDELARLAGVHPVHLARVFRKRHGCTVGEYVRHLRVEFALRQLSETTTPLSDIAAAAGFSDHSHFARTLRALLGVTPSEYRAARK